MSTRRIASETTDIHDQGGNSRAGIPESDKAQRGSKRVLARWRGRTVQGAVWAIALFGISGIVGGLCWALHTPQTPSAASSGELSTLLETGTTLETEIARTVRPAMQRTDALAKDRQVIQLIAANDTLEQTAWLNRTVTTSTEVDALALFDSTGKITAINTQYADGKPIPPERVRRILGADFSKREIIEKCLRNGVNTPVLEFQTHCDITPAFFDSTGLSVAYSVPVFDPKSGAKIGVISARLRFDRLSSLVLDRVVGAGAAKVYLVTDEGAYFSETINANTEQPPIPVIELRDMVRPLMGGRTPHILTQRADKYVLVLPLKSFQTLQGGGVNVLVMADERWVMEDTRRDQLLTATAAGLVGTLLLIVAGLLHAYLAARRMRATTERASAANARLAAIVQSSTDAIVGETLDGTITSWNPAAEKIFGFAASEVEWRPSELLEPPDRCHEMVDLRTAALANKRVDHVETQRVRKDGQLIDVSISLAVIKDRRGATIGIAKIARDITRQKRSEYELRKAFDEMERRVAERTSELSETVIALEKQIAERQQIAGDMTRQTQAMDELRKSEANLAEAQRIAHLGSWNWDLTTNAIQWSDEHYRIWGMKPQECTMTAELAMGFLHPDDLSTLKVTIDQAIRDHQPYQCKLRVVHKDGTMRIVQSAGQAAYDDEGKPISVYGTAQDITERQLAEDKVHQLNAELEQRVETRTAALQESEERFRQFAENTKDVFWMTTANSDRILYVSPRYEAVWGRPCRDLYANAHDWINAIEPEDRPSVMKSWMALPTSGEYEAEYRIRRPDGTIRWIRDRALPIRDERGEIYRIAGIAEDFTDRRAVEQQVIEAKEAAETANRAKSEFLANMSHEIRTPLNGVIGITDLLLNSALDAQQQRFARLIKTSGQTLADLLNDILDFSKIEARKLELESIDFDLHAVLEDVIEVMAHQAAEKGLELASCVGPDVPKLVRGDPARVKQILVNLVNNAIKFTTTGSISTRLTLASQSPEHVTVRFAVADTGIGIGPEGLNRLFKSFSQVEASTTRTYGGTGLGLVIAKQLAELMGGAIGVESMPGQGSTFWFTVKLGLVPPAQQPRPAAGVDLRGLRVLAVDGNATMREILREQIGNWGLDVATAADGAEGLKMLATAASEGQPYHIAILESEMTTIDGLALAQIIKSRPDVSETGLLILLPMDTKVEPNTLRAAGFCGHLLKPVRQSHLHDAIMNAIAAPRSPATANPAPPIPVAAHGSTGATHVAARQARILLAEDNSVNQVVASEILARHGYTYDIVDDGKKAVEAAALRKYDLILMDCSMPEMDGFEATAEIRRNEASDTSRAGCRVPIVALTANAIKGDRELCIAAGMDAYVSKPVDARRLIETIESLLAGGKRPDGSAVYAPVQEREVPAAQLASAAPFAIDELLDRCMGNISTALTIIDEFEKQVAHDLPELALNLAGGDGARAAKIAHALKGAAGVLSANAVHHSAADLERLCRTGNLANVDTLLSQLRDQVRECIEFIPGARTTISAVPQTPQVQGT